MVKLIAAALVSVLLSPAPASAVVTYSKRVANSLYDRDPVTGVVTRLIDPALGSTYFTGPGYDDFVTDPALGGFAANLAGARVETMTDLGIGFLKVKSMVDTVAARDGGQSYVEMSFADTITVNAPTQLSFHADLDGTRTTVATQARYFGPETFRLLATGVAKSACHSQLAYEIVPGDDPAGQARVYVGCQAITGIVGNTSPTQVFDAGLDLVFDAVPGLSYTFEMSFTARNRIEVLTDVNGLPDLNRGPASSVLDLSHTAKITDISATGGATVTAEAGPLVFARGHTTYAAVQALAVPEPGVWALMIVGFGGVGIRLRSRRGISDTRDRSRFAAS